MAAPVVVVAETIYGALTPATLECVEEARDLADSIAATVHVILPGHRTAALADELAAHGADRVTLVEHPALEQFSADGWLAAVAPVLREPRAVFTLAPDSGYGRTWLPRLSARWRIPLATACIRVKVTDEGYPEVFRVSHDGKLHERQIWARGTAVMVMLSPGVRGVGPELPGRRASVEVVEPEIDAAAFRCSSFAQLLANILRHGTLVFFAISDTWLIEVRIQLRLLHAFEGGFGIQAVTDFGIQAIQQALRGLWGDVFLDMDVRPHGQAF